MSQASGSWPVRLIAAGCIAVVGVGVIGIATDNDNDSRSPSHAAQSPPSAPTMPTAAVPSASVPRMPGPGVPQSTAPAAPGTLPPAISISLTPTPVRTTSHRAPAGSPAAAPSAGTTPVSTRHATGASAIPPGVLGTFSYATTGGEDTSFPGTARTYPSTTKIRNTQHGCGVLSTWKPISEHVQSQLLCPDGASIKLKELKTTLTFYGVSSGEDFICSGDSYVFQPGVAAGHVWRYQCKSADAVAKQVATVIGYEKLSVGGTPVRTLHVSVATTITGSESGKSTQQYWIATNKPVLVKELGKITARQQNVQYQSTYSLMLDSLTPKT